MRWDRDHSSSDIEDRRAEGGAGLGGGGGGGGLLGLLRIASLFGWRGILFLLMLAGGYGAYTHFSSGSSGSGVNGNRPASSSPAEDELVHFVGFVFDDTQNVWRARVPGYTNAHLVLFRNAIRSGCGTASSAVGPFYCPMDHKVYIDLAFYDMLRQRLGAPRHFAQAYVNSHENGHHVQNTLGIFGGGKGDSAKIELQADCLAGVWAKDAERRGELENGDL